MKVHEEFIRQAIDLALKARLHGNHPFGALLAIDDRVVLAAENTVNSDANPTSHAETNLIQKVIKELTQDQIARSALYTSCEPCAMCSGAIYWAGVRKVIYALSSEELSKQTGGGLLIGCREVLGRGGEEVEVHGPIMEEEAIKVHEGYWGRPQEDA